MGDGFLSQVHEAFVNVKEEIDEEGSEFDFR